MDHEVEKFVKWREYFHDLGYEEIANNINVPNEDGLFIIMRDKEGHCTGRRNGEILLHVECADILLRNNIV